MNRNFKLGLAGIGFLGINGAFVPLLNENLKFSDFSFANLGGGDSHIFNPTNKGNHETPKIDLRGTKSTTNIDLDSSKSHLQTPKLALDIQGEGSLDLNSVFAAEKNNSNLSESISRIYQEVGREERVAGIEQTLENQYLNLFKKQLESQEERQKVHMKNFQDVKEQFKTENQPRSNRGKREVVPQQALTQTQRDALFRMFNLHNDLKKESKKLSTRLEDEFFNGLKDELVTELPTPLRQTSYKTEDITRSLMEIGWTGGSIKTQKNRSARSTSTFSSQSWGEWNKNPFRHFYSREQDFKEDIKKLQSNAMSIYKTKQEQARLQGRSRDIWSGSSSVWEVISKQYSEINKKISDLEASKDSHIVSRIAKVLLESMGQP